jgi:hypothetical protein
LFSAKKLDSLYWALCPPHLKTSKSLLVKKDMLCSRLLSNVEDRYDALRTKGTKKIKNSPKSKVHSRTIRATPNVIFKAQLCIKKTDVKTYAL